MRIAVTGATGFVARGLLDRLRGSGYKVRGLVRHVDAGDRDIEWMAVDQLGGQTDWRRALVGVDVVIHLAALTHKPAGRGSPSLQEYRSVNVDATRALLDAASRAEVRRFIYVSSIKVNGERTHDRPFHEDDPPRPVDAYAISKLEAERAVEDARMRHGIETVVVRPPLVYGPRAKGNFARLVHAVRSGTVLPFGAVRNRRSLVSRENLVDLLLRCLDHPSAVGRTFLVSDGHDVSTPSLIKAVASALGTSARLAAVPPRLLLAVSRLAGMHADMDRLVGSLQVDITHARMVLEWTPRISLRAGIEQAVNGA